MCHEFRYVSCFTGFPNRYLFESVFFLNSLDFLLEVLLGKYSNVFIYLDDFNGMFMLKYKCTTHHMNSIINSRSLDKDRLTSIFPTMVVRLLYIFQPR